MNNKQLAKDKVKEVFETMFQAMRNEADEIMENEFHDSSFVAWGNSHIVASTREQSTGEKENGNEVGLHISLFDDEEDNTFVSINEIIKAATYSCSPDDLIEELSQWDQIYFAVSSAIKKELLDEYGVDKS